MRTATRNLLVLSCCGLCLLLVPAEAFPWGGATHAYFASELTQGRLNDQEVYGALAPDLFNLDIDFPHYAFSVSQTHRHLTKLKREARRQGLDAFAFGFVSHNERWGADRKAHRNRGNGQTSYVLSKSGLLASQLRPSLQTLLEEAGVPFAFLLADRVSVELSHTLVEMAIDVMIKRNEGPGIGFKILHSAQERPASIQDLLIASYGKPLARYMAISEEEAGDVIREAETEFQQLMIQYGGNLVQEESEACRRLADQGAGLMRGLLESATGKEVPVTAEFIADSLTQAMRLVEEDYAPEIESTLVYLKRHLDSSRYLRRVLRRAEE